MRGDDGFGPRLADQRGRGVRGDHPDHARPAVHRPAGGEQRRPGETVAAGQQAEDAPAVLVRFGPGPGQQVPDVVPLRCRGGRPFLQVRAQADVDELDGARVAGPRVDQQPGLDRAEGHGDVGADGRPVHRAGVGLDAAGQVDGDHGGAGLAGVFGLPGQGGERLAQAAPAADAEQSVDDQVGAVDGAGRGGLRGGCDPAARGAQRGGAARVGCGAGRDRGDGHAAAGQQGPGVERVAAVVPAAGQHDRAAAVHLPGVPGQQGGAHRREPGGGPGHQRPVGDDPHQRLFGRPHGVDLVRVSHGSSYWPARASRTSSASWPMTRSARAASLAWIISLIVGSVPLGRTRTRPSPPS